MDTALPTWPIEKPHLLIPQSDRAAIDAYVDEQLNHVDTQ
jgi:hypothetical protein